MKQWYFTIALMVAYAAIFHVWKLVQNPTFWLISGIVWAGGLAAWLVFEARRQYFVSRADVAIHAAVVLDILLEAILISTHHDLAFYWCAFGFAIVIAAYRWHVIRYRLPRQRAMASTRDSAGSDDGHAG